VRGRYSVDALQAATLRVYQTLLKDRAGKGAVR
jgi:hypothetical protein